MQQLYTAFMKIWERKWPFLLVFFVVVTLTYGVLYAMDIYPEPPSEATDTSPTEQLVSADAVSDDAVRDTPTSTTTSAPAPAVTRNNADVARSSDTAAAPDAVAATAAEPLEIEFSTLGRTVPVKNPTSRAIADLDAALLEGAVRHPDSADFAEPGNMFILGHSSYLPNVINQNFQAFNGIQKLEWGDTIILRSAEREYRYRVDRVYEALASEVIVPNSRGKAKLTLATCDSFGSKDDRYIVEATLIESTALARL